MKEQKGFVTLMFLTLMPVIVSGVCAAFFCFSFLKSDLAVMNVCRAAQLRVHGKVAKDLKRLLDLNPDALRLRAAEKLAQHKLALAIETANPYAIGIAEARLLYVQSRRQALSFRQKTLIQSANMKLSMGTPQISKELQQEWNRHNATLTPWLRARLKISRLKTPQLAVRADFPDVAPAYELQPRFEEAESWVHTWQIQLATTAWVRNFLKFDGSFQRSCATSLYTKDLDWIAKLKKVRF